MQVPTRVLAEHQGLNGWHLHAAAEETAWSKLETVHLSSGFSKRFRPFRVHEAVWQGRAEANMVQMVRVRFVWALCPLFMLPPVLSDGIHRAPDGSRFASRTG